MYFFVYDASGKLRFKSDNWPMARSALDLVISETPEPPTVKGSPRLFIGPDPERMIKAMKEANK